MTDDLTKLGNGLADTLMRAAEEQVSKAQMLLDQTKALVEIIRNQVSAQAKQNDDMVARFKDVGERMLDIHRMLNGDPANFGSMRGAGAADISKAPSSDLARLRALNDLKHDRAAVARAPNASGPAPAPTNRDPAANYPARPAGGLSNALADLDQFRVNRPERDRGEDDRGSA